MPCPYGEAHDRAVYFINVESSVFLSGRSSGSGSFWASVFNHWFRQVLASFLATKAG
ncbi:hypothetical protein [Microcoleus sp. N3A4]|uniref:hypothetical protein n=1 Tax=Microcoleus sp. N3A4 TaxID=3055379 RepID=UPI002FD62B3D